jgi:stearoyl-CoA desaturase (delta-9 desaturase)
LFSSHPYFQLKSLKTTSEGKNILIGLAVLHSSLILGLFLILQDLIPVQDVALHTGLFVWSGLGVAAGYHRLLTHRSYQAHPVLKLILLIGGSIALMGPPILWVATHLEHHRNADREGDPHSARSEEPGLLGHLKAFVHAHLGWMARSDSRKYLLPYLQRYSGDSQSITHDPIVRFVQRTALYWAIAGFVAPTLWGFYQNGWMGGSANLFESVFRSCLTLHIIWLVNSLGHMVGERPFRTGDLSANWWDPLLSIASFGELLHNNHHAFQNRAYYALKWWQVDLAGLTILLCRSLGLATQVKLISKKEIQAKCLK